MYIYLLTYSTVDTSNIKETNIFFLFFYILLLVHFFFVVVVRVCIAVLVNQRFIIYSSAGNMGGGPFMDFR